MRKHIKLLVSVVAVVCIIATMMIPSFAAEAESGKLTVIDDAAKTTENNGVKTLTLDNGTISWAGLGNMGVQDKAGIKQLGLGPVDVAHVADAYITFEFNVETAGKYTIKVGYSSKTGDVKNPTDADKDKGVKQDRAAMMSVNDAEATKLNIDQTSTDWNVAREVSVENVELKAGKNTVKLTNPANFDDNYVKSINVISVEWTLTEAAKAPETDAPTTDAPTTDAPTTDAPTTNAPATGSTGDQGNAPKTGVVTVALAIAAIGTGAYVVSKRKH